MATKRRHRRVPLNKGKIVGQKAPLKLREIWAIRVRLQLRSNIRDLALFNLRSIQARIADFSSAWLDVNALQAC